MVVNSSSEAAAETTIGESPFDIETIFLAQYGRVARVIALRKRVDDGSDYLFTSQKGGKLSRIQFFRNFQRTAEGAGLAIEKRHPHVLKHSLASHLVAGNANLALIRQALGHRSINSTLAYVGTTDAQAAEALQRALMCLF
jgi:site-specific recombinase XerD